MPDIERYADEPDVDEVVAGGGLPRWLALLAVLLLAVVVVAVVRKHTGGAPSVALPTPSTTRAVQSPGNVAYDLASGPLGTWLLETGELAHVSGSRVTRSVLLHGVAFPDRSMPLLAVDPAAARVWVVLANAAPSRMIEFDAGSLRRLRDVRWPDLVQHAVALRGHLYVTTDFGVADLAPGATRPRFIAGMAGAVGPLAVDPTRDRLVATDLGYPTDVWTYRPGTYPMQAAFQLPLSRSTVTVVDGQIWVGGFGLHTAVLTRLDPTTLRPVAMVRTPGLGPGAMIVGAGSRVFWLRPGSRSDSLTCVDAHTGAVQQTWHLAFVNAVASGPSGALVATPNGVLGLIMSRCAG